MAYNNLQLFDSLKGLHSHRQFALMTDVIQSKTVSPSTALLRFDVERDLPHHLEMAKRLQDLGVCSTMYFHTRKECYQPDVLHAIQNLGHEVGFHHECLDRCAGDFDRAQDLFRKEVEQFRADGFSLETVCSHGEAGLPKIGYRTNYDLFTKFPTLLNEMNLKGEVYHWVTEIDPLYSSDTFVSYRKFWSVMQSSPEVSKPYMILVHYHRWHQHLLQTTSELFRDVRQHISNKVLKRRKYELAF